MSMLRDAADLTPHGHPHEPARLGNPCPYFRKWDTISFKLQSNATNCSRGFEPSSAKSSPGSEFQHSPDRTSYLQKAAATRIVLADVDHVSNSCPV